MRRRTFLWMIPLVGIMAVIAMAVLFGASSGDAPVRLTGENVVEYDHSDSFAIRNAERKIDQGDVTGSGCKFTTRLECAFGEPIRALRTLAADFDTCRRVIEKGSLTTEDIVKIDKEGTGNRESSPATSEDDSASTVNTSSPGSILASPLQNYASTARFRTTWEDPPNLDVNWVQAEVEWLTSNGEVFLSGGECEWYWLPWWTDEGGQACTWSYNSDNTQIIVKKPTHGFENTSFECGVGAGAETSYTNNRVGGTTSGSWGSSTTSASGDCAWLLSSSQILD